MFNHLKTISRINTVFSLCLLLIACTACIEVNPAPPAPKIPTPKPSDILHIGIDPNLVSLQTVLSEQLKLSRNDGQMTLFVTGSSDTLQRQVAAGELDSIFTYQKPAAPGLWTMPVALDSIAVIAHPSLNLSSLTRSDLQQIFAGDIQSWQSISGQNRPVSVFVIGAESGTRELFNERVMENRPFVVSAVVPLNLNAMLEAVAQTEGGVGFLPTSVIGSNT
ncbi:MAG: DNA-binding transcriptional LysR family regulator, partial [Cellvibrionaceae bacterium]